MASHIENYGFIGDMHGSALVSRDGSIDWLCMPRFDSDACMAALLGRDEHGCWLMYPGAQRPRHRAALSAGDADPRDRLRVRRRQGTPHRLHAVRRRASTSVIRIVEGLEGTRAARLGARPRASATAEHARGSRKADGAILMTTAPDSLALRTPAPLDDGEHERLRASSP